MKWLNALEQLVVHVNEGKNNSTWLTLIFVTKFQARCATAWATTSSFRLMSKSARICLWGSVFSFKWPFYLHKSLIEDTINGMNIDVHEAHVLKGCIFIKVNTEMTIIWLHLSQFALGLHNNQGSLRDWKPLDWRCSCIWIDFTIVCMVISMNAALHAKRSAKVILGILRAVIGVSPFSVVCQYSLIQCCYKTKGFVFHNVKWRMDWQVSLEPWGRLPLYCQTSAQ